MQEYISSLTNLLLLSILAGVLFVSGNLQHDLDNSCRLGQIDRLAVRVDDCHVVYHEPTQTVSCPNDACHQGGFRDHRFGGPEYQIQQPLSLPLASSPHPVTPDFKAGDPFEPITADSRTLLAFSPTISLELLQSLRELRTTVLLN